MKIFIILILIFLAAALAICLEIYRETHCFRVEHYQLTSGKLSKLDETKNVIFFSDLHNQTYGKENQELLEAIRQEQPDLILIGGDLLVGKDGHPYEETIRFLQKLTELCPVYYGNGNHEQRLKERPYHYKLSYARYQQALKDCGVCFLENETEDIFLGNVRIKLTGLEIPLRCYRHFRKEPLSSEEIISRVGNCDTSCYHIILAHNPLYMETYAKWGADLVLSGHLHGGIVRIPNCGGVIAPNYRLFPRYCGGEYHLGETMAVVSRGLGMHTLRIRLFNPAELSVLHLTGNKVRK